MTAATVPALEGEKVRLRPLTDDDAVLLARWYGDPEVNHWSHLSEDPPDQDLLAGHRERLERIKREQGRLGWLIETKGGEPIGEADIMDVHAQARRAELGITIGDKSYWGQGYGGESIRLVLRHAFGEMGLRRVYLITDEDNERAQRSFAGCGFAREGLLRAHRTRHGRPLNMVIMGVLREEFEGWDARPGP